MNAYSGAGASHPHMSSIPDARSVEGGRAYREPEQPHPLQLTFLDAAGEQAWVAEMAGLLCSGRTIEADARLTEALSGFDGSIARLCRATAAADVAVDGWEDLLPILDEWEGPPIRAITLGLTNPPDLVFESGLKHEPDLMLALYSDEAFPFSSARKTDLLAECGKEEAAWIGAEEDVEFFCTLPGLTELNTALINCKHRRFLRDGRDGVEGRAPGGYVEYVLGCWLFATRFLQAAEQAVAAHGMPDGCRVIAGTLDINADFVTILGPDDAPLPVEAPGAAPAQPAFATLTVKPWVPSEPEPIAAVPIKGATLRQRLIPAEPEAATERPTLRARLFGWLSRN
jgi:hypothetical protein